MLLLQFLLMSIRSQLLHILSDRQIHSGVDLSQSLGVPVAAVRKQIRILRDYGIAIDAVPGHGYRLLESVVPLDKQIILGQLGEIAPRLEDRIEVLEEVGSTNTVLMSRPVNFESSGGVCLAEYQTAGRGRHGRGWVSSAYRNIMMSILWSFKQGPAALSGLSLAAGVAVVRALRQYGVNEVGIKWPNDVLWRGRKLSGILLELCGEASGPTFAVVGLAVNVRVTPEDAARLDQPWTDVETITNRPVDRNRLAAQLIACLYDSFAAFGRTGIDSCREQWNKLHLYTGQQVSLCGGGQTINGLALGADDSGALLLKDDDGTVRRFYAGDVSLRR